jgi:hypothetical protein
MREGRPVLIAVAAVVVLAGCSPAAPGHDQPATTPSYVSADTADEHDHDDGPAAAPSAPPDAAALKVARDFTAAWARPDLDQATWYAAVRALTVPGYAQLFADTNPANVPARRVTGVPRPVSSTTEMLVADVPTDTVLLRVTVASHEQRWLVAGAQPVLEPS